MNVTCDSTAGLVNGMALSFVVESFHSMGAEGDPIFAQRSAGGCVGRLGACSISFRFAFGRTSPQVLAWPRASV